MFKLFFNIVILTFFAMTNACAENRVVDLTIAYKTVNFTGKSRQAIAVNNQIPAPTLHFKEGDHVTLRVHNDLKEESAIHWHGMIVPWQMDGIQGISQQGIPPGGDFEYQFTLHQSGTYWYHAHAGLQEQQGLYGAFIIDPPTQPNYSYTKDFIVILSDWSNTHPDQILANLKKEGSFYSPNFPLQSSLFKFIHDYNKASSEERKQLKSDYKMMQQMRMGIYDLSDVAYDAFLLNGQPNSNPWTALVKMGDTVRLRFIGAGGSTIFHMKIPNTKMQIVHVEGNDVEPLDIDDFYIAPGETYDVLVKILNNDPAIIYAESIDTVGAAIGALVTSNNQTIDYHTVKPFPEPLPVTREMMDMMMGNMQDHTMSMSMGMNMEMPTEPTVLNDTISKENSEITTTPGTKYDNLKAAVKTNNPDMPISGVINMELFGYMDRYIWFINGVPEYAAKPIVLEPAKRYRLIFTNNSMMRHPMHMHGHWFILRNGNDEYDPLLHTIEVEPGATIVADVDTDASGQWFFHCHLLYHMVSGMSRVFQYSSLIDITHYQVQPQTVEENTEYHNRPIVRIDESMPINTDQVHHPMAHPMGYWKANFLDIGADPFRNIQKISYKGLFGMDMHKLELFTNDAEFKKGMFENGDVDIFYWHPLDQFWSIKGGVNFFDKPAKTPYWQPGIGIEGLMPYFIETGLRAYFYNGSAKLDAELARDTQITNNFFIKTGVRGIIATKSVENKNIESGINQLRFIVRPYYRLMPGLNLFTEYEYEHDYGDDQKSMSLTIGLSTIF